MGPDGRRYSLASQQTWSPLFGRRGCGANALHGRCAQAARHCAGRLMAGFILAIDQGTTSSRAILFDETYRLSGVAQQEFPQHFPRSGWVEHDPEDLWRTTLATMKGALTEAKLTASDVAAIVIT